MRSFEYAALATVDRAPDRYPLAYWIAFRGGRWKNLLLLFIIGPFFVTYLIRTLAWETILADNGLVVTRRSATSRVLGLMGDGRLLGDVDRGRSRASPTTSCPSWRCRSTSRSSRSTRG